jgi:hypothetical protein
VECESLFAGRPGYRGGPAVPGYRGGTAVRWTNYLAEERDHQVKVGIVSQLLEMHFTLLTCPGRLFLFL